MIDRQGRKILVECDCCPAVVESEDGEEWGPFWAKAKAGGWKSRNVANEWVHGCPKHKV